MSDLSFSPPQMRNSYLILDEYVRSEPPKRSKFISIIRFLRNEHTVFPLRQMRFLDCREGSKRPSRSILDVGVKEAICFSGFDEKMFLQRGGKYVWSKADMKLEW